MTGLKKMLKLVLAFIFALTMLAGGWGTQPAAAADPPDEPVCTTCGDTKDGGPPKEDSGLNPASVFAVSSSEEENVVTFRKDSGEGLDYYTSGSISFSINIHDIDVKTVEKAALTMAVWDVDYNCSGYWSGPCERDTVSINGNAVSSPMPYLTGADGQWSTCTFDVDPAWLVDGDNTIVIVIDLFAQGWMVECDWGQLALTVNDIDLMVESKDISITPNSWWQFWKSQFQVEAKIHNTGAVAVEDVVVKYLVKTGGIEQWEDTQSISKIKSKSFETITFSANLAPDTSIEVIADPDDDIEESKETNNSAETTQTYGTLTNSAGTKLKHTAVAFQVPDGANWKDSGIVVYTDDTGKYWINNNLAKIEDGKSGRVTAYLKYSPTDDDSKTVLRVIDDSKWGIGWTPTDNTPSSKSSDAWNMDKAQNFVKDLAVADNEGGLAYSTLITCYDYHKARGTAPANETKTEINDTHHLQWGACALADSIFLPVGAQGTTWVDAIAHEYTHVVEQGWNITNQFSTTGHNPNFPVAEGSCHWGSAISRNDSVFTYPADGAYSAWVNIDIASDNETSGGPPVPVAFAGARQEFQIAGVMWDLNTDHVWSVLRNGGATAQDVGDTHKKFYTIYKDKDPRDSTVIKGIFQAHADNTTGWPGKDGKDPDNLNGSYSSSIVDINDDDLADYLQVTVGVTIDNPGYYYVNCSLTGIDSGASTYTNLSAGSHTVTIRFSGEDIYASGLNGPYNLSVYLVNSDYERVDFREHIYQTAVYSYTEFAHPAIIATGDFDDSAEDTNSNSLYDVLLVDLETEVNVSTTYEIYAGLYAQGEMIAYAETHTALTAGTRTIQLSFDGKTIRASGKNGPYTVQTSLPNGSGFTTSPYNATSFEGPGIALQSIGSDSGNDSSGDGLFETLVVPVNVNCTLAGIYSLKGTLYDESQMHIASASANADLSSGTSEVILNFDGIAIRNEGLDGPYAVSITLYDDNKAFLGRLDGTTSAYTSDQFQIAAEELFDLTSFDSQGTDTNINGLFDFLTVNFDISSVAASGNYRIDGYLDDEEGNLAAFSSTSVSVGSSPQQAVLDFSGQQIWRTNALDSSYVLRVKIFDSDSTLVTEVRDLHTTGSFSFNQFEPSDTVFNDIYEDEGTDTNGDSFYDYLTIEVGVDASIAGSYTVNGLLSGSEIAWATAIQHLEIGTNTVELKFDGNMIYLHGEDGPYVLKELSLKRAGVALDYRDTAYTTDPYDYDQFGQVVVVTGDYTDEGEDTDSDGLFNSLRINVEVIAKDYGSYAINGRIMDGDGKEIVWAANQVYLNSGIPQYIPLNFDGIGINKSGSNGPYYLRDLYIYNTWDASQSAYVSNAYATGYYNYDDFDSIINTTLPGIRLGRADLSVSSIYVNAVDISTVDTSEKPFKVVPTSAYNITAYGSGQFTLRFTNLEDIPEMLVYDVETSYWMSPAWSSVDTIKTSDSLEFSLDVEEHLIVFGFESVLQTPLQGIELAGADSTVTSILVSSADVSGVDKAKKPAWVTPNSAYYIEGYGSGSFSLKFIQPENLPALVVYKVTYSLVSSYVYNWENIATTKTSDSMTFSLDAGEQFLIVFGTVPVPKLTLNKPVTGGLHVEIAGKAAKGYSKAVLSSNIRWDWGDGTTDIQPFPGLHHYSDFGGYTITVTAYQADGSLKTETVTIELTEGLAISNSSLPDGIAKEAEWGPVTLTAIGGAPPYTWAKSGSWPSWLKVENGVLSGLPAKGGTFIVGIKVTDANKNSDIHKYKLFINPPVTLTVPKTCVGDANLPFPAWAPTAVGGDGDYTWSWSSAKTLPPGLNIDNNTGAISGTPTVVGSFKVNIIVTDGLGFSASKSVTVKINKELVIEPLTLPNGEVGIAYKASIKAIGGTGKYTLTFLYGYLPYGLTFSKGTISGKPVYSGSYYYISVQVTDQIGTISRTIPLTVFEPPVINNPFNSTYAVGDTINCALTITGVSGKNTWTKSGNWPPSLKLDSKTETITGTLTKAGTYTFTLSVKDSLKGTGSLPITIVVNPAPTP